MSRTEPDYKPLVALIERDGGKYCFEDRSTGYPDDDGPVLVELLTEHVRIEWVSLPEHEWFRAMAKDQRATHGIPMVEVYRIISGAESPLRRLRGNVTSTGLKEGWTRVGANSRNEDEPIHHGFSSIEQFRGAAQRDAVALSAALSSLLSQAER